MGRNLAASLGIGRARRYKHNDLGLVADLGGWDAVARPLGVPLTGPLAKVVTRGYHLYALPAVSNRVRVAADWLWQTILPPESTQLSVVRMEDARIAAAQGVDVLAEHDAAGKIPEPASGAVSAVAGSPQGLASGA
jgi:NADH dehydrogenase